MSLTGAVPADAQRDGGERGVWTSLCSCSLHSVSVFPSVCFPHWRRFPLSVCSSQELSLLTRNGTAASAAWSTQALMLDAAASAQTLALGLGAALSDPPQSYRTTLASWDALSSQVRHRVILPTAVGSSYYTLGQHSFSGTGPRGSPLGPSTELQYHPGVLGRALIAGMP